MFYGLNNINTAKTMRRGFLKPHILMSFLLAVVMSLAAVFSTIYPMAAVGLSVLTVIVLLFTIRTNFSYYLLIILLNLSNIRFDIVLYNKVYLFSLGEVFVLAVFLLWFFSRTANLATPYSKTPCDIPILLFFSFSVLSLLWSDDYKAWTYQFIRLSLGIGIFLVTILLVNNKKILHTVIWIIIVMGIFNSISCFVSVHTYPHYTYVNFIKSKLVSFVAIFNDIFVVGKRGHAFAHPLTTAYWLNFAIIFTFGKFITAGRFKKTVLGLLMFFMLTAHLTTLSKGPLLALFGGAMFLFYSHKLIRKVFFASTFALITIIIMSFLLANITDLANSARYTYNQVTGYNEFSSGTSRMNWWIISIQKSLDSYGLGVGLGGIPKYLTTANTPLLKINIPHSHNVWINTFGDLGFIGLGLLVSIYLLALKTYLTAFKQCKNEYYRNILLSYISGFIIMLLFILTDYDYTATILWWYMGLGFAIAKLATEALPEFRIGVSHS